MAAVGFQGSNFHKDGGFGRRSYRRRGEDLHADISVTFDEAAFGCEKVIHLENRALTEAFSLFR